MAGLEAQYSQTVSQLESQLSQLTTDLNTKTFEFNLKSKEVAKLKEKQKESDEILADMEAMAIEVHTEHLQEVEQLEAQVTLLQDKLKQ